MAKPNTRIFDGGQIITAGNFLSQAECADLINLSEQKGYEAATVNTPGGHHFLPDWRNNTRVIHDDFKLATWLWQKAERIVPPKIQGSTAIGINERLRFYRYDSGQQFDWHTDGYFERENGERSRLTFMVYLNQGFDGGETLFSQDPASPREDCVTITPREGLALFFTHMLLHKGEQVQTGRKYVLRSDVMYTP